MSLVSPWAMLFRLKSEAEPIYSDILVPSSPHLDAQEREVLRTLVKHGFDLITKAEAATPIDMTLAETESDVRIYHALISDDGIVPQVLK